MARTFEIPQSPKTYRSSLVDFLGVDYNNPLDADIRHSPNMMNMMNRSGYLKKRNGVKIKKHIDDAPIYGIWQYDVPSDSVFKEIFVIHCGSKLYECSTDFKNVAQVMSGLAENDSYGMFLADKLVILDGKKAIVYGKYNGVYGPNYMDSVAYVPTTNIGLSPQGFNGTAFEDVNLMTQFRINEFLADGVSDEYYTDSPTISPNANDTNIWILSNETGLWEELDKELYTVYSDNKIVFDTVPEAPLVSGRDNIRIKFKSTTGNSSGLINRCRFCVPFGYQGNNQRLFFSGNPDQPNVDWHSGLVEAQPDPTYIPDTSFAVIGSQPISGYLRLSDGTLAILKKLSDTDCSIYYRTSNAQGKWDIFPLQSGTKNVGCLSIYTCSNVGNFPMFLSEQGVYQAITGEASSSLERYADNKSYYINTKLLTEENLDKAKAISLGQYYWLFINGNVYVADTLKWTETKINTILQFQWYPLEGIECRSIMKWNNQLVIGDDYGNIKMFGDDYVDDLPDGTTKNVESYFETIPLDFTNPTEAKTTRNFTLNYIAPEDSKFEFGYKTIDEESVTSEEIFKRISGTLPIDYDENPQLPYGTKLNFNKSLIPETNSNEGFLGFYYGTQTDELKTIFGLYKAPDSNLTIGIYTVEVLDSSGTLSITPIKLFFDNNSYILDDFLLKKLLHGSINQVNNELNIPQLDLSDWNFSYIYLSDPILNNIPQTITLKEKARKIMFLKFFVQSTELACEFDRIYIQYRNAGKYRGE